VSSKLAAFEVLKRHGVPFVIVGGHAVYMHGYQRDTEDADAVWLRSPASEVALLAALNELAAGYIGRDIDPATRIERVYPVSLAYIVANHLMMLVTTAGFLDLFDYVPGHPAVDVNEILHSAIDVNGYKVVSVRWLRRMKEAAARPKDLVDLEHLQPDE
jgi:hypothetical protein